MMQILMFAMIGMSINAKPIYWVCYGVYIFVVFINALIKQLNKHS